MIQSVTCLGLPATLYLCCLLVSPPDYWLQGVTSARAKCLYSLPNGSVGCVTDGKALVFELVAKLVRCCPVLGITRRPPIGDHGFLRIVNSWAFAKLQTKKLVSNIQHGLDFLWMDALGFGFAG